VLIERYDTLPRTPDGTRRLDLQTVRDALDDHPAVNWAFLTLRGTAVRLRTERPKIEPAETADPTQTQPDPDAPQPILPGSIRELANRVLLKILKVEPDALRVRWSPSDDELLDQPVDGRVIHAEPIGRSSRIPLSVTIYDGDRIVRTETVRADITVRRPVFVVAKPIRRGAVIKPEHFTPRTVWVKPDVAPARSVAGETATRRLDPGTIIENDDVSPPIAVERGEIVMLHCIAGAVALKTPARALDDARAGEVIELEMQATGKRVTARINGPGRAVLAVPTTQQAKQTTQ